MARVEDVLVAAAVCPHPPLLVPELGTGATTELAGLRDASLQAVRRLVATEPEHIVVVGSAESSQEWDHTAGGNLAGYGAPVSAGGRTTVLPLSLTLGAWLLDTAEETETGPPRRYVAVADRTEPEACAELGAQLVAGPDRVALLVMGDGSAKRTTASPGYLDARGTGFDAAVATALRRADPEALLALDPELARELWVAGRAAWQVLAGAAQASYMVEPDLRLGPELTYDAAPFGVGYLVALWLRAPLT